MTTWINDLEHNAVVRASLGQTISAPVNGAAVDCQGTMGLAQVYIAVGTPGGTGPSMTLQVQESDDQSTWVALETLSGITSAQEIHRRYARSRRYLRVAATAVSGTSPTFPTAAIIVAQREQV